MAIFNSYVSLPEGNDYGINYIFWYIMYIMVCTIVNNTIIVIYG